MNEAALVKALVAAADPLAVLYDALVALWRAANGADDVDGFFGEREAATNRLERFVHDTYFEIYGLLLQRIRAEERARYFTPGEGPVVLLDGMSIREAALLPGRLASHGYTVEPAGFMLSEAPSSTQAFVQRVFGAYSIAALKHWNGLQVVSVRSGEVPAVLPPTPPPPPPIGGGVGEGYRGAGGGADVLIWLSYPDELLHRVKGQALTPAEALDKTVAALVDVLGKLEGSCFRLLSDHGYVYAPSARYIWKAPAGDEKELRRLFGGGRWAAAEKMDDAGFERLRSVPPQRAYALFDEQGCYVRGRYSWSTQGAGQGDVDHYGLSLMECLTPRLVVRRG